uniref:3FTx-Fur-58 n=1 Tax=Furina ornata TaxID=529697 RepID=R4FIH0_9SAUR
MKTLLLTLVVVTIVCLDLGYPLVCLHSPGSPSYSVCAGYMTICYRYDFSPIKDKVVTVRGCSASCPGGRNHVCCSTDMCNE